LWLTALIGLVLAVFIFGSAIYISHWILLYSFEYDKYFLGFYSKWISVLFLFLLAFFLYKYVLLVVMSPILSKVSEKVEYHLNGVEYKKSIFSIPEEIIRGMSISIWLIMKEIFYTILLIVLSFIPGLSIITTPLIFSVQSYFLGVGTFDYYAERKHSVAQTLVVANQNRWLILGVGAGFNFLLLVPIIGVMIAPIMATISLTELSSKREL
jgi:CysZ protein